MAKFTGLAHVTLTVRDVDRSAVWYEEVLGMRRLGEIPEYRTPGVAARVDTMLHAATGVVIGFIEHEHGEAGEFSEMRVGLDHLALLPT